MKKTIGVSLSTEELIRKAIKDHGGLAATWAINSTLPGPRITRDTLKACKALAKAGKIKRSTRYGTVNNYVWEVV